MVPTRREGAESKTAFGPTQDMSKTWEEIHVSGLRVRMATTRHDEEVGPSFSRAWVPFSIFSPFTPSMSRTIPRVLHSQSRLSEKSVRKWSGKKIRTQWEVWGRKFDSG